MTQFNCGERIKMYREDDIDHFLEVFKKTGMLPLDVTPQIPMSTNCKNCGAPITSCKCEYCGTMFAHINPNIKSYIPDEDDDGYKYHIMAIKGIQINNPTKPREILL